MRIKFNKKFSKQFNKLSKKIQKTFYEKLAIFIQNKQDPILNNHKLKGKLKKYRSINITSDYRAVFQELDNGDFIFFMMIGTHSNLYQ